MLTPIPPACLPPTGYSPCDQVVLWEQTALLSSIFDGANVQLLKCAAAPALPALQLHAPQLLRPATCLIAWRA